MAMNMGQARSTRRRGRGRAALLSDMNVTPLVDVMLVLLIIFMVTAPMLTAGVPIDLPDSRAEALKQQPHALTISMDDAGRVFLDQQELAPGELDDRLTSVVRDAGGTLPQVTLRADRHLDYGRVIAVMGALNNAGFKSIALVTNGSVEAP